MSEIEEIERRLVAAVDTLRALPDLGAEGDDLIAALDMSRWPEIVPTAWALTQAAQVAARKRPSLDEVLAMQEAIGWLEGLGTMDQEIVWLRAMGEPWRRISERVRIVRPRLWQRWRSAIVEISRAQRTKGKRKATAGAVTVGAGAGAGRPPSTPRRTPGGGKGAGNGAGS